MNQLEIRDLRFAYGRRTLWSNVRFELPAGALCGILGNNGVGKSTLLNCIGGILPPAAGSVRLNGEELLRLSGRERARRVSYVAQRFESAGASVYDTVLLGRMPYFYGAPSREDHEIVERVLDELAISSWRDRSARTLSGGEAQKVMLARALAQQTPVLLLDEPTASLDIGNQIAALSYVSEYARRRSAIVLMVSHDLHCALRFCTHFVLISPTGEVESVEAGELTEARLSNTYGHAIRLLSLEGERFALVKNEPSSFSARQTHEKQA